MRNSKYGKFLTVLLIIAIIAIVGLLIFFGIDMYQKYYLDSQAEKVLEQFEGSLVTGNEEENNNNNNTNTQNTTDNPFSELEDVNFAGGGSSSNVVMYEDYIVLGRIEIPKTGRDYPILHKVTTRSLEIAVATIYSPGINEVGNTVIMGHNYRNGTLFSNNKMLELGDKIYITDNTGRRISYTIYNKYETDENDASYMTRDTQGKREISLSTCTDEGNKRLIIWARED